MLQRMMVQAEKRGVDEEEGSADRRRP